MIPFVDLKRQNNSLKSKIDQAINQILTDGNFVLGKQVSEFEESFARYCGTKYCVGVASGTDAILLILKALGISNGDEIITVSNTFISTVLPIIYLGAKPILVDINPETYQIDTNKIEQVITSRTKAIIPVHLYGIPAQMDKILKIAKKYRIFVVEDACQAHGATVVGKKCGSFGTAAAFSFYPGKNLGGIGDGGAIVTNDKNMAKMLFALRNIGQYRKYSHDIIGYNSRLDTINAAVLSLKLKKLNTWNQQRRTSAFLYRQLLKDLPIILPPDLGEDYIENYHLFVVRSKKRDELFKFLVERNISCQIHYPIPVHLQKCLKDLKYKKGDFPITEEYAEEVISLPIYPGLSKKEIRYICSEIRNFFIK